MARFPHFLTLLLTCVALAPAAFAQKEGAQAAPEAQAAKPSEERPVPGRTPTGAEFENVRKALNALTPQQLKQFQQNFIRWSNLSPEEKKLLRDRDVFRKKKMAEELEAAIGHSGLNLNKEQRELFAKRYAEERRKLEEQLRQEMETLRRPRLQALVEQLKVEFSTPAKEATPAQP